MDEIDRRIVNALQDGFPLCDEPYEAVARPLGLTGDVLIARLRRLLDDGVLTRFGPLYQVERMGGAFVLAALAVPEGEFEQVTERVNAFAEVAHNYRRAHQLNMWLVIAAESAERVAEVARAIEAATGLDLYLFPKEREYFVALRLVA